MSNCGCAMQAPQCEQGTLIFANLAASYHFLTSQEFLHLPESRKVWLHAQYEGERQQYFAHIGENQKGAGFMTDWAKPFMIANLYRTDLTKIGLTYEQIEALSELDMLTIAHHLGIRYLESVFVAQLQTVVNDLFLEKEQKGESIGNTQPL